MASLNQLHSSNHPHPNTHNSPPNHPLKAGWTLHCFWYSCEAQLNLKTNYQNFNITNDFSNTQELVLKDRWVTVNFLHRKWTIVGDQSANEVSNCKFGFLGYWHLCPSSNVWYVQKKIFNIYRRDEEMYLWWKWGHYWSKILVFFQISRIYEDYFTS